jgi:hypothetical protein
VYERATRSIPPHPPHLPMPCVNRSHAAVYLMVLSDYLVADPRMVRDLHSQGVPHLPVRVRDGTGLVGPPGHPGSDQLPRQSLGVS